MSPKHVKLSVEAHSAALTLAGLTASLQANELGQQQQLQREQRDVGWTPQTPEMKLGQPSIRLTHQSNVQTTGLNHQTIPSFSCSENHNSDSEDAIVSLTRTTNVNEESYIDSSSEALSVQQPQTDSTEQPLDKKRKSRNLSLDRGSLSSKSTHGASDYGYSKRQRTVISHESVLAPGRGTRKPYDASTTIQPASSIHEVVSTATDPTKMQGQKTRHPEMAHEGAKATAKSEDNHRNAARTQHHDEELVQDLENRNAELTRKAEDLQRSGEILQAQLEVLEVQNKRLASQQQEQQQLVASALCILGLLRQQGQNPDALLQLLVSLGSIGSSNYNSLCHLLTSLQGSAAPPQVTSSDQGWSTAPWNAQTVSAPNYGSNNKSFSSALLQANGSLNWQGEAQNLLPQQQQQQARHASQLESEQQLEQLLQSLPAQTVQLILSGLATQGPHV